MSTDNTSVAEQDRLIAGFWQDQEESKQRMANKSTYMDGKLRPDDWDPELYIRDMYEQYLQAAQQEKITLVITFEQYLSKCIETLTWRKAQLDKELKFNVIDRSTRDNAMGLADAAIEAITKYLELPDNLRLIGV